MREFLLVLTGILAVVGAIGIVCGKHKAVAMTELIIGVLGVLISLGVFPLDISGEETGKSSVIGETNVPNKNDLIGCDDKLIWPRDISWLDEYEKKVVKSKHGVLIYLRYEPDENAEHFYEVDEGTVVTVLARENGMSLVKVMPGISGWARSELLK